MHGDVEPSGDDLLSGRVPRRTPEPSRSRIDDDGDDRTFHGIMIGCLGFSDEGVYMGGRLTPGSPVGPTSPPGMPGVGPVLPGGVGAPKPSSVSPSVSVYVTVKY